MSRLTVLPRRRYGSGLIRIFLYNSKTQGISNEFSLPEDLPLIHCDPDAIGQCLANLLENAVKYSGDSRRIDVRATTGARSITIAVRDYGIGIPKERHAQIFDEFYRVERTYAEGLGLGLYLVKRVMDAHRGRVEVDSEPGRGSEFRLVFPGKWRKS